MSNIAARLVAAVLLVIAVGSILDGPVLWIYMGWNLLIAFVYAVDKMIAVQNAARRQRAARKGRTWRSERWRIAESKLLWSAALFGASGALFSMLIFWHKIKQRQFYVAVPLLLGVQLAALWWLSQEGGWLTTRFLQ